MYQLVTLTHWTPEQIDAAPARLLDYLLEIDRVVQTVIEDRVKAKAGGT